MTSFIRFHNYLKLRVPTYPQKFETLWRTAYGTTPTTINFNHLSPELQSEVRYIQEIVDRFHTQLTTGSKVLSETSQAQFEKSAYFSRNGHDVHPWLYLKTQGVSSLDIFSVLSNSNPFGMGCLNYKHCSNSETQDHWKELTQRTKGNWVYLDYWNGIGFKMSLPKDIQAMSDEELLKSAVDYRRYDDRNEESLASKLVVLSEQKSNWTEDRLDHLKSLQSGLDKTIASWSINKN
jgi:hypothetical protein